MLIFLPYLYIFTSHGIFNVFNGVKNKKLVFALFFLIFSIWFIQTSFQIKYNYDVEAIKTNKHIVFQDYLDKKDVKGSVWISNPLFAVNSDKKINELMYYPTFSHNKFLSLKANLDIADNILIDTCDLHCEPYNKFCKKDKTELINLLKTNFDTAYNKKEFECESYIFRK